MQQNFKLEALQEIPNSRDLWSLLAVTPAVTMGRLDVGGDRAGTQSGYTAYGYSGQNRVLVEGINTTEGTSGAGFYVDYGSFEEVFLGTIGQGAEMPTPGVQSQMLGKSGGNKFQGEIYQDYENNGMIARTSQNIPSSSLRSDRTRAASATHSNEMQKYRDFNINVGGPIKKDKVWWYFSYRNQKTAVGQPNFVGPIAGTVFNTQPVESVRQGDVSDQPEQQVDRLLPVGPEEPAESPAAELADTYTRLDQTLKQCSGSWIYKGEWNGTVNKNMYVEARYGVFGYYFPLTANSDTHGVRELRQRVSDDLTGARPERADRSAASPAHRIGHLLQGWLGRLAQLQGRRRDAARDRLVRLHAGGVRQRARELQQRHAADRDPLRADGDACRQPRRRPERQPAQRRQAEYVRRVHQRPVVRRPRDVEPRRALRSLPRFTPDQTQLAYSFRTAERFRRSTIPGADATPRGTRSCRASA